MAKVQGQGRKNSRVSIRVARSSITEGRGGGPELHEVLKGDGGVPATPPFCAEVAVVEVPDVLCSP